MQVVFGEAQKGAELPEAAGIENGAAGGNIAERAGERKAGAGLLEAPASLNPLQTQLNLAALVQETMAEVPGQRSEQYLGGTGPIWLEIPLLRQPNR